ncbi:hypothetical protein L6R46_04890 [Myxococcota bacterium]|nr:hypothetical protein [Myxococcota bacterium]
MRASLALVASATLIVGCRKEEGFEPAVTVMDAPSASAVIVDPSVGSGSVLIPVRVTNTYGVAVANLTGEVTLSFAGEALNDSTATLAFDPWGYGEVELSSTTPQEVIVTVTNASTGGSGGTGSAYITGGADLSTGFFPGWLAESAADEVIALNGGLLMREGGTLTWQAFEAGSPTRQVAAFPDLTGLTVGDVDEDGTEDVVVWRGAEVHLLRGRPGGGLGYKVGYEAQATVRGVAIGRFDGVLAADVAILYSDDSVGGVQLLSGDGVWGFEPTEPRELFFDFWGASAGDWDNDGLDELAMLASDEDGMGVVYRYELGEAGWATAGITLADDLDRPMRPGSRVLPGVDITGDGLQELLVVGVPPDTTGQQPLAMYTFASGTKVYELSWGSFAVTPSDVSGDGTADLVVTERDPDVLRIISVDTDDGQLINRTAGDIPPTQSVAVADTDGEDLPEILLHDGSVIFGLPGERDEEVEARWKTRSEGSVLFGGLAAAGPVLTVEIDGSAGTELLLARTISGVVALQVLDVVSDEEGGFKFTGSTAGRIDVDGGASGAATALDLAYCDGVLYALISDGGTTLYAATPDGVEGLDLVAQLDVSASAIACGDGATFGAVVVLGGGEVAAYDATLALIGQSSVSTSAEDVAVATLSGAGAEIVTCEAPGCSLLAADLDLDGFDEVIEGGDTPTITGWASSWSLPLGGVPTLGDFDGDGLDDVLFTDITTGRIAIHLSLVGAVAPARIQHTRRSIAGPALLADGDGDEIREVFMLEVSGGLYMSRPSTTVTE